MLGYTFSLTAPELVTLSVTNNNAVFALDEVGVNQPLMLLDPPNMGTFMFSNTLQPAIYNLYTHTFADSPAGDPPSGGGVSGTMNVVPEPSLLAWLVAASLLVHRRGRPARAA